MKTRLMSLAESLDKNRDARICLQNIARQALDPVETVEVTFRLYSSTNNRVKLSTDNMSVRMQAELHTFMKKLEICLREEEVNMVNRIKEELK